MHVCVQLQCLVRSDMLDTMIEDNSTGKIDLFLFLSSSINLFDTWIGVEFCPYEIYYLLMW